MLGLKASALIAKKSRKARAKKTEIIPLEHTEQVAFVQWFRLRFNGVRLIAIPNGGARAWKTARAMKAEGQSPGVPDMYVPAWALWIEMKRRKGSRMSGDQADWCVYLQRIGQRVIVAYGFEDAKAQVEAFLREKRL